MSFTDLYFEREEKRAAKHTKALMGDELDSGKNFREIYDSIQDCKNVLEISLEDDDTNTSLCAYGDEFISDMYALIKKLKEFENKYEELY